jgi:hypothetical protein
MWGFEIECAFSQFFSMIYKLILKIHNPIYAAQMGISRESEEFNVNPCPSERLPQSNSPTHQKQPPILSRYGHLYLLNRHPRKIYWHLHEIYFHLYL